jgi:SAM-dependent methyltransferase
MIARNKMGEQKRRRTDRASGPSAVQAFYDRHPYPPPVDDLDGYSRVWQDERRRRADFHLHWPEKTFHTDYQVLVAGCGTSQAAKHALRQPASHVVGIDFSQTSVRHTEALRSKYNLTNLEVYQLPIERVRELGKTFDKIVCTGVLHHLPDPEAGLRALHSVLEPDGVMDLMVYAAYGRAGIYMLQEYCRRLRIGQTDKEIQDLIDTLTALPYQHPLARLLGETPDFQNKDALADALLNPQDRAYTVPQLFDLIESCGLRFGRWVRQGPYLPHCGSLASTPHAHRLEKLPPKEQFAAVELFRGTLLRHNLIVYRDDLPGKRDLLRLDNDSWPAYVPIRLPEAISVHKRVPPGAVAVLLNQAHGYPDLVLPVSADEMRIVEAINGERTIDEIIHQVYPQAVNNPGQIKNQARRLFEKLYWYDQVVFDASGQNL